LEGTSKIITIILVGVIGIITIIGLFTKKASSEDAVSEIEVQNTTPNSIPSINTTTTTKTSKKTIKTTKKKTTKKVVVASLNEYQEYAKQVSGYDDTQMSCLIDLWNRESGWNPNSYNKSSGACGIPQAKPCNKIKKQQGSNDWKAQIRWGINYITYRYKTPCEAWKHFKNKNWY